ncbi:hypothetical protein QBK99_01370 [Corticibacterium sp. UT-5YL-CI-8]|nr:hypothetical protein [Tianweitania sp. UT-5YL-CI-8]
MRLVERRSSVDDILREVPGLGLICGSEAAGPAPLPNWRSIQR